MHWIQRGAEHASSVMMPELELQLAEMRKKRVTTCRKSERSWTVLWKREEARRRERRLKEIRFRILRQGILTAFTVLSSPSPKTAAVISANQIFARVSVHAGLSCTLIRIWKKAACKRSPSIQKPSTRWYKETRKPTFKAQKYRKWRL